MNPKIKCPYCGSNKVNIIVPVKFKMPFEFYRNIKKYIFTKKEVSLMYAEWDKLTFVCDDCLRMWNIHDKHPL